MIYITETMLYICFALLAGNLVIEWMPEKKRPIVVIPRFLLYFCTFGIVVLSMFPLIDLTIFFAEQLKMTFWQTLPQMLQKMEIGKGWLLTIAATVPLFALLRFKVHLQRMEYITMYTILLVGLALSFSWSSHVSYIIQLPGFFVHSVHFLAVMVWIGGLLIIGWFGRKETNWSGFLGWFTPLSVTCLLVSMITGLVLMNMLVSNYVNSWILPYGQALLWKHIFIVLLVTFAFTNGVLIRNRLRREKHFDPRSWFRTEGVVSLLVFAATAIMGQQESPHNVKLALEELPPSNLFALFHPGNINGESALHLVVSPLSIVLGLASITLLVFIIVLFFRRITARYALLSAFAFAVITYLAVMYSVSL